MDSLIKRKSIIKGQITKILNFAKACNDASPFDDMKVRLDKLNRHYQEFVNVEDELFKIDSEISSDMDKIDEDFCVATTIFSKLMRQKIHAPVVNINNTDPLNASICAGPSSDYKLPRLSLPTFSGNGREWQSFYDIFKATVHENTSLSPAQKFQYLKGQLRGAAEKLVRHFRIDDANYIEAFQKLVKRYDRKRHIVNEFIDYFVNQPSIKRPDASTIGKLYDTCDEVVRGLKALGTNAELRDCWLVYLIEQKLDETTLQLWRQDSSENDFPSFNEFLEFLSRRINSLEGTNYSAPKRIISKGTTAPKTFHTGKQPPACTLCNGQLHRLCDCPKFLQLDINARRQFVSTNSRCFNCFSDNHVVKNCSSKKTCHQCRRKHHTLVHPSNSSTETETHTSPSASTQAATTLYTLPKKCPPNVYSNHTSCHTNNTISPDAILPTASIEVQDLFGNWQTCRALLDSASTRSYITEACINRLNIPRQNARFSISTMNGAKAGQSKGVSKINCRSKTDSNFTMLIDAYILPKITSNLPSETLNITKMQYLQMLPLADPSFHLPAKVDLLIGSDRFFLLLSTGQIIQKSNLPVAQKTKFGWIVGGSYDQSCVRNATSLIAIKAEPDVDKTLRRFWELEEMPITNQFTDEEQLCIEQFNQTTFVKGGRITVSLPFKPNAPVLGNSLQQALRRFNSIEQKLLRNPDLKKQYSQFIAEYESLGHMEPVPVNEIELPNDKHFYLPHHPVFKEASTTTKLRVVFDASAKSQSGFSLNDKLLVGPTIQQPLFEILLRFRKHRFVFTADIEKMFRQVWMNRKDIDYQRIVWREEPNIPIKH